MEKFIFNVYHPLDGDINYECKKHEMMYDFVAFVETSDLNEAFKLAQNDFNVDYARLEHRSTCVGDIITTPTDSPYQGRHYMVMNTGFQEVPKSVLNYCRPGFEAMQSWAQMVLDNPEDFGLI